MIISLSLAVFCLCALAHGETEKVFLEEEALYGFAENLFREKDYFRAATEFKRYIFLHPQGKKADEAHLWLGEAQVRSKAPKEAILTWQLFLSRVKESPLRDRVRLRLGWALWETGRQEEALKHWEMVLKEGDGPAQTAAGRNILWSLTQKRHFQEARALLATIALSAEEKGEHETYFRKSETLPFKSPATAGVLAAILPGSGHLYLGRPRDGALAFLVNGLFIWGAVSSFREGNSGVGVLLSFIELTLYSGNIYSAVNSAHKANRKMEGELLDNYRLRFGLLAGTSNSFVPGLAFNYVFP